jgi:hypothetical protein
MKWRPNEQYKKSIKGWFFEKIKKIGKPLTKLTKRRKEKTHVNNIRDEKGNITTDRNEILKIIW